MTQPPPEPPADGTAAPSRLRGPMLAGAATALSDPYLSGSEAA